ncbi:MAG: helix-turn-helix domain-containing protein [Minisyncoccia bacterium]
MKYLQALERVGLSKEEAVIYETLLERGQLNMSRLSQLTEIHRPGLYRLVPKMVKKGIVAEVRNGKRTEYRPCSPNKLEPLVKSTQETLENVINDLNTEFSKKMIVPKIETYYGRDGIGHVFMDVVTTLTKGETYYRYSIRKDIHKDFLPKEYRQIRDDKKLERLAITNEAGAKRKTPKLERFVKILHGDYETFNVTKIVYQHKIAFIDYENEVACVIFNERMAKMEKEIFMRMYKIL